MKNINFKGAEIIFLFLLFFTAQRIYSQDSVKFEMSASKYLMGTEFTITVVHTSIDSGKKAMYFAMKEIERIENVMSNYKDSTEISYVNKNAFLKPIKLSGELFSMLERCISYSKLYEGYFDVTVGPLTNYWGFNSDHPIETLPDSSKIKELLELVNYNFISLDYNDSTIRYKKDGVIIDLGGIAKGYALDKASEVMKKKGVRDFIINGGGDLFASGRKANGNKWVVGIKNPRKNDLLDAKFEVENTGVMTSGDYERFKIINMVRYHHIFNPKTGFPSNTSRSATVITDNCEKGVVLSKLLFITGQSMEWAFSGIPYYRIDGKGNREMNFLMNDILKNTDKKDK